MKNGTIWSAVAPAAVALVLLIGSLGYGANSTMAGGMGMMPSKTGDLNTDGTANSLDALLVLFHEAGLTQPPDDIEAWTAIADVDCDLEVTALDAALILQVDAGLTTIRP